MKKRVLVTGDWHCGHVVGLTPPEWQYQIVEGSDDPVIIYRNKYAKIQRQMWKWWTDSLEKWKPFDRMIVNGDSVDGKGERSGGTEQITTDRFEQGAMSGKCAEQAECDDIASTYGTPYHVGTGEDFENAAADKMGATIESHLEREVEGVRIDARHFISGSTIPHGRYTALAREDLWRLIWADRSDKFAPHIVLRSHVHYYAYAGNEFCHMSTVPCMQGLGSKFGSRKCSGTVSLGFLVIDCEDGKYTIHKEVIPLAQQVSKWKPW